MGNLDAHGERGKRETFDVESSHALRTRACGADVVSTLAAAAPGELVWRHAFQKSLSNPLLARSNNLGGEQAVRLSLCIHAEIYRIQRERGRRERARES